MILQVHFITVSFYYVINIPVYFGFVSLFFSCNVVVFEPILLLIALFSRLGYKFNKHLLLLTLHTSNFLN